MFLESSITVHLRGIKFQHDKMQPRSRYSFLFSKKGEKVEEKGLEVQEVGKGRKGVK